MSTEKMRAAYHAFRADYRWRWGEPYAEPLSAWDFLDPHNRRRWEQIAFAATQARPVDAPTDAERLDFMMQRGYYIGWSKDGEVCSIMGIEDEEVGFQSISPIGYEPRALIDAAMRATPADGGEV